jgi:uncharacterized protein
MKATRRQFLAGAAASAVAPQLVSAKTAVTMKAQPFPLGQVRLLDVAWRASIELNRKYLRSLDADRLLHTFRVNAGLPSDADPLGGWETPDVELRGHFSGHYLTACAQMSASVGDKALADKAGYMVAELAKCQRSLSGGYLSAFPLEFMERLRDGKRVWAPWYTLHKIMAGLLDVHRICGNRQALEVLQGMAGWTEKWAAAVPADQWQRSLEVEHGGMLEVLFNLAAVTGDERYAATARRFDHKAVLDPLAAHRDQLKGLHVNTQIPKIVGAASGYEFSGDPRFREIASYFWNQVTGHRCYCTGGTSNQEFWRTGPDQLAVELSANTQECCCTYNLLKLTRRLFQWEPDARLGDYYERALFNGILGTIHPVDGLTMYYVPLASGYWKLYGRPLSSFWCCTGTGVENFSKLADSIYFHDGSGIWVNLYVASELDWQEKGIKLRQETKFPEEDTIRFTVNGAAAAPLALRLRIPYWAARGVSVKVNGKDAPGTPKTGEYFVIERQWANGDSVELRLPMSLRAQPMPDDAAMQAFMYGPLTLAGDLGGAAGITENMRRGDPVHPLKNHLITGNPTEPPQLLVRGRPIPSWLKPDGVPLRFATMAQGHTLRMMPLNRITDQRYAVYWRVHA